MNRTLTFLTVLASAVVTSVLASALTVTISQAQAGRTAFVVTLTTAGINLRLPTCDARP